MRLTLFLLIITTLTVTATNTYAQNTKISLSMENGNILELLQEIKTQTDFSFLYNHDELNDNKLITISVNNKTIDKILDSAFTGTDLSYEIDDKFISIHKKTDLAKVPTVTKSDQEQITITGTVVDENGEGLPGVSVRVKGTTIGVLSNMDGKYTIAIPERNSTLTFSFVGFTTQEVVVGNQSIIDLTFVEDSQLLDEVVVIGYGVQRKSDITGSISSVSSEDLVNVSKIDVASALQGKSSGVQVVYTSGAPGTSADIRVRGVASNAASSPLYIVDGLKVTSIDYLDSDNIASMEVLKDAASAAIYGAEAGNGVILITTKSGSKSAEGQIFYNGQYSFQNQSSKADLLNAEEYIDFMTEAGVFSMEQIDLYYYDDPSNTVNGMLADTDWQDVIYSGGYSQRHTLGFQGGNDKGTLYVSVSYADQDGIIAGDQDTFQRISTQINGTYDLKSWISVGVTNSIEKARTRSLAEGSATSLVANILQYDPLTPVEYEGGLAGTPARVQNAVALGYYPFYNEKTGEYYGSSYWSTSDGNNPLAQIDRDKSYSDRINVNGTLYTDIKPFKGLVYTSRLGYRISSSYNDSYTAPYWGSPAQAFPSPELSVSTSTGLYYQWENFANYSISLDKSTITALAGMSYIRNRSTNMTVTTDGLTNLAPNYRYLDNSSTSANDVVSGNSSESAQIAYYGRLGWSYDSRYNVLVNFRADAFDTSKLDESSRWGYFPSISGGWTASNESFMRDINPNLLSFLKFRLSYGKNGSISNLSGYQYSSTLSNGNNYYMTDDIIVGTYPGSYLANTSLRWEESKQIDAGADIRLLKDRLSFTTDFYSKNTDGMLIRSTAPLVTGTSYQYQNLGVIHNHGFEFDLSWKDKIGNDFSYGIDANMATVYNEVTEYLGEGTRLNGSSVASQTVTYFEEGYPVWYFRGYVFEGVDPTDGSPIYKDVNNSGDITDADKEYLGSAIPKFTYGTTINLSYKNFDLVATGTGSYGQKLFFGLVRGDLYFTNRFSFEYDDRWTADNTDASRPAPTTDTKYYASSAMLFDASFFKIKQIQLGYNLPKKLLDKASISNLRVYCSLDDYFTFTKYPGMDPETRASTTSGMGIDSGAYPISSTLMFGVNMTF